MKNECYSTCPFFEINNFSNEYDNYICHYLDNSLLVIQMRKEYEPLCKKYKKKAIESNQQ